MRAVLLFKEPQKTTGSVQGTAVAKKLEEEGFKTLSVGRAGISIEASKESLEIFTGTSLSGITNGIALNIPIEKQLKYPLLAKLLIPSSLEHYL